MSLEEELRETLNAVGMEVMVEVLSRADTKAPTIEVRGERWGNRRETMGSYTTLFGEVKLERSTYSPGGGGKVMIPLDLRLGIVERRYTPKVARILTHAIAVMTSQEAGAVEGSGPGGSQPLDHSSLASGRGCATRRTS